MNTRMTWNPIDPAPYESAWSVFVKLMALNFCKPADIADAIKQPDLSPMRYLAFRDSAWIDFDRYGVMIGVNQKRLRAGFLDQLGFPKFSSRYDSPGIRFCPECLKSAYHCILFDLALVTECPIHGKPLEKGCPVCCTTVERSGLSVGREPYRIDGGVFHDTAWRSDTYYSKCNHVRFDPENILGIRRLSFDDKRKIRNACEDLIRWWSRAFSSSNALPALVARLARESYQTDEEPSLGLSLDIADRVAGECPWPTSIPPSPASWLSIRRTSLPEYEAPEQIEIDSDLGKIYRSIRRHIFEMYVRPVHRTCWRTMVAYRSAMSRCVSGHHACTVVLAFMCWRMSIEGFSNIEAFGLRKSHKPSLWPIVDSASTPTEISKFWLAQFFAIFGRIEWMIGNGGNFYIERSERNPTFAGFADFLPDNKQEKNLGTWYVSFANEAHVSALAAARCAGRNGRSNTMLSVSAVNQMSGWGWTGELSSFNRPYLLFRIKDDSSYSKSYDYLYL